MSEARASTSAAGTAEPEAVLCESAPAAVAAPAPSASASGADAEQSPHHKGLSLTLAQVDELMRSHLPTSGGCMALERIQLGFNNISYVATACSDEKAYVIRATKDTWPAEKVECEMACIKLMSSLTSLPVPTPLCWDASADEFGCRWILMEKMEGRVMDIEEFDALAEPQRVALINQMVGFVEQLQALKWESTGSFYPNAAAAEGEGRAAVTVGPYFDGNHGPFHTSQEFALGMLRSAISEAEKKPALDPLVPYAARARVLADHLTSGSVGLPDIPIVAFHGDFSLRNMLVKGDGADLRISALLDWEWGGAKPAHCEWADGSFGEPGAASSSAFQTEAERRGLICQSSPGFAEYLELQQLGEALNPWVVGCFGPDRDAEEIEQSKPICESILQKYKL
jgi:aminoglycoside phosphotransferase (APT) family kinase protein